MSEIREYYCDRCGKRCKEIRNNRGFHIYLKKFLLVNVKDDNYVDLCQSCYDDLSNWWKSGKKESEDSKSVNNEHWIDNHNGSISCSHCHTWFYNDHRYSYMHYCPNCGVKMEEKE